MAMKTKNHNSFMDAQVEPLAAVSSRLGNHQVRSDWMFSKLRVAFLILFVTSLYFRSSATAQQTKAEIEREHQDFVLLFSRARLPSKVIVENGMLVVVDDKLTKAEWRRYHGLPSYKAWVLYESALKQLQRHRDRKEAFKRLKKLIKLYPHAYHADTSRELSKLLGKMIVEDGKFVIPKEFLLDRC